MLNLQNEFFLLMKLFLIVLTSTLSLCNMLTEYPTKYLLYSFLEVTAYQLILRGDCIFNITLATHS